MVLTLQSQSPNGINLYAYCLNNPVMMTDSTGHAPEWLKWLGIGAAVLGVLLVGAAITVLTCGIGVGVGSLAGTLAGAIIHGAAVGTLVGAGIGITAGAIIGGATTGWSAKGILLGAAFGFGGGALAGAIIGGAWGGISYGLQQAGIVATKVPIDLIVNNPLDEFVTIGPKAGQIAQYTKAIAETGKYGQIFATKLANGMYQIANGHHRIAALIALGYEVIKVYFTK